MNEFTKTCALNASLETKVNQWSSIDWQKVEKEVRKLQMRIAKATEQKQYGKVKSLQWILTHSYNAKLLAVKRVTSNKGKYTAGIDNITWDSETKKIGAVKTLKRSSYKPLPLRRVYIPKKNGKMRPLSIPCMKDRAMQALHLLALEPVAEITATPNSYGFRTHRSCQDAIEHCFGILCRRKSPQWVLDADIKSCFDEISHEWILKNIPMDKKILQQWLKAGYIERTLFYHSEKGTPQGGIISPTIANMVLDGIEVIIKDKIKSKDKINIVRYADDFIVTAHKKENLEQQIIPIVETFLKERGLNLSKEKTKIVHISQGFDFLSQNIRKYNDKLLIKPTKETIKSLLTKVKDVLATSGSLQIDVMIKRLNSVLRGWGNYHKHVVSKQIFNLIDKQIFVLITKWLKKRHPNKSWKWMMRKYFSDGQKWCIFNCRKKIKKENKIKMHRIFSLKLIPIKRYRKIKSAATPYKPEFSEYFQKRELWKKELTKTTSVATHLTIPY